MTRAFSLAGRSPWGSARWVCAAVLLLALAPEPSRAQAPVEITVNPSMVKGPTGAAVTIIEFSDYQ